MTDILARLYEPKERERQLKPIQFVVDVISGGGPPTFATNVLDPWPGGEAFQLQTLTVSANLIAGAAAARLVALGIGPAGAAASTFDATTWFAARAGYIEGVSGALVGDGTATPIAPAAGQTARGSWNFPELSGVVFPTWQQLRLGWVSEGAGSNLTLTLTISGWAFPQGNLV